MTAPRLGWPPATSESGLVAIESSIAIARPVGTVFEFATFAARWPLWHPATASVTDVPDRPLVVGDQVTESIRAGTRSFSATWTVEACQPPALWVITTHTSEGIARIIYRMHPQSGGCRFERMLEFRSLRWPWRALDSNLTAGS
jgi:uncharacterized protein YndB with AHSA1/START domain